MHSQIWYYVRWAFVQLLAPTALPEEEELQVHIEFPEGHSR